MCYFEDCEDRYWPPEDNTPDCPCDCDNSTDTGNTNPGGTGTTNPGGGHICICNCDDCADGTCGTTRYYKPGESFCLYNASHSDLYAWSTEPSIIFVGTDGKAVAIREGSAYICIRSRSNPAFRRCIRVVATNTPPAPTLPMSIEICDENGTRLSVLGFDCCWQMEAGEQYQFRYHIANQSGNPEVKWSVDDRSVLHVDQDGLVTAVGIGEAILTVSLKNSDKHCTLDISVDGYKNNFILYNEFSVDNTHMTHTSLYNDVNSGLMVKYYMADIDAFKIARTESYKKGIQKNAIATWKQSIRYGTNAALFGGNYDFPTIVIYNGESLQYNYATDTPVFPVCPSNGDSVGGFSLFLQYNESSEPVLFTRKKHLCNDTESQAISSLCQSQVKNIKFGIGGMDLISDSSCTNLDDFVEKITQAYMYNENGEFERWSEPVIMASNHYCPRTVLGYNSTAKKVVLGVIFHSATYKANSENIQEFTNSEAQQSGYENARKWSRNGSNLYSARQIMKYLGCDKILNLDGGGSTRIAYKTGNRNTFKYAGTREVFADIFIRENLHSDIIWATDLC